jgi:hypothetical protein
MNFLMKLVLWLALVLAAVEMPAGKAGLAVAEGTHWIIFRDGETIPSA